MAHKINTLLSTIPEEDKVLVICGVMSMCYGMGVVERVLANNELKDEEVILVTTNKCHQSSLEIFYGPPEAAKPAHIAYICQNDDSKTKKANWLSEENKKILMYLPIENDKLTHELMTYWV